MESNAVNKTIATNRNKPAKSILITLKAATVALRSKEDTINKLNVYPVPDGDTGTNMLMTMQSVISEGVKVVDYSMSKLTSAITYGSLVGARGNSGVILSQIIRGICEELDKSNAFNVATMTKAFRSGADAAYAAVRKPVEGTMLTVIKDMAGAAERFSKDSDDLVAFYECVVNAGQESVDRTPSLLPVLKEAGVVDAGGFGLVVIMQGILGALKGERNRYIAGDGNMGLKPAGDDIKYAYCTEFVLKSGGIDMRDLEDRLEPLGDSMLIVGTVELTKIHIHTNSPGEVLNIATSLGSIDSIEINNMVEQSKARAQAQSGNNIYSNGQDQSTLQIGVIAVANGMGIKKILQSLGVDRIISGGQSMNPSTGDILRAINDIPQRNIIVLPNNKNIILAAQQAVGLSDKNIKVLPTKSIPEAFSAMTAFERDATIDENLVFMQEAISMVKTGEITNAARADVNGSFKENDFIGLHDHAIKATGSEFIDTSLALLKAMVGKNDEVITILVGDQVSEDEMRTLSENATRLYPDYSVDIHRGDQPVYHLLIGIE
jgi:DAK2 domain fusion protein YloV